MAGELLKALLPLPVPAGVYGLFLLLAGLCSGIVKLESVEDTGNFLLDIMPLMFIPVTVGLMEDYPVFKTAAVPIVAISAVSTVIVMVITGKVTQLLMAVMKKGSKTRETSPGKGGKTQ